MQLFDRNRAMSLCVSWSELKDALYIYPRALELSMKANIFWLSLFPLISCIWLFLTYTNLQQHVGALSNYAINIYSNVGIKHFLEAT